ncbi:MAG: hypothetical protein OEZ33_03125 [Gammaproteobacteria bacterium]|nr:hypothetical protein [Gammaproteobacteria bacterium]MDH5777179.1 hypothetical protein [Gammaproteobacteria bacterium]
MKPTRHRLPKPIYECLPYCYILLGIFIAYSISSSFAIICGALLIAIGLVLLIQRHNYRSDSQAITQHQRKK